MTGFIGFTGLYYCHRHNKARACGRQSKVLLIIICGQSAPCNYTPKEL